MRIPPYGFTEPVIALSTDETVTLGVPMELLQTLSAKMGGGRHTASQGTLNKGASK
ncbi:hypothetical protein [Rhizobium sp. GN54]|uniref:hypothetical protein n=1 Tax=Rhizobium sp. GN54 TaxID=2898150 RepID=UPI001E5BF6CE|nr:hypothetical protein [Rhizobium sp. GN54]MCD2185210.1 hypothetical protein [Rhizobium sp. GN54]